MPSRQRVRTRSRLAFHSSLQYLPSLCNELHCRSLLFTAVHCCSLLVTIFHCFSLRFSALPVADRARHWPGIGWPLVWKVLREVAEVGGGWGDGSGESSASLGPGHVDDVKRLFRMALPHESRRRVSEGGAAGAAGATGAGGAARAAGAGKSGPVTVV